MKLEKIGEGLQYSVYDLKDGRVLKKRHSLIRASYLFFQAISKHKQGRFWKIPWYVYGNRQKIKHSIKLINSNQISKKLLANPIFDKNLNYTQDKIMPLHIILDNSDIADGKKLILRYIEFTRHLLSDYGFIDRYFNMSNNCGINSVGEIVLIDLGELIDDQKKIEEAVQQKIWINTADWHIDNPDLRLYFIEQMDLNFLPIQRIGVKSQ